MQALPDEWQQRLAHGEDDHDWVPLLRRCSRSQDVCAGHGALGCGHPIRTGAESDHAAGEFDHRLTGTLASIAMEQSPRRRAHPPRCHRHCVAAGPRDPGCARLPMSSRQLHSVLRPHDRVCGAVERQRSGLTVSEFFSTARSCRPPCWEATRAAADGMPWFAPSDIHYPE
jgi:hypothetical protein